MLARLVPYDVEVLGAFAQRYHEQLWPAQPLAALVLALLVIRWAREGGRARLMLVAGALALLWAWSAVAWEWRLHGMLNWAGPWLGGLLGLQALLMLTWAASRRRDPHPAPARTTRWWFGIALVVVGLAGIAGIPRVFAVAITLPPAPLVTLTVGVLLLGRARVPLWLLIVPLAWSAYALAVALTLSLPVDTTAIALALVGVVLAPWPTRALPRDTD